jgi:hypothetical protein
MMNWELTADEAEQLDWCYASLSEEQAAEIEEEAIEIAAAEINAPEAAKKLLPLLVKLMIRTARTERYRMTTQAVLDQIARSKLLPSDMAAAIRNGNTPPLHDVVTALVTGVQDAEAMTAADRESTWAERRIARQVLTIAFLLVIAGVNERSEG